MITPSSDSDKIFNSITYTGNKYINVLIQLKYYFHKLKKWQQAIEDER